MTSIILKGQAGQGIQLLSQVLAKILADNGYEVAVTGRYSAFARAEESQATVVFSDKKIENPLVEEADVTYDLGDRNLLAELTKGDIEAPANMVLLGRIITSNKLKATPQTLTRYLPRAHLKENLAAFKKGLTL